MVKRILASGFELGYGPLRFVDIRSVLIAGKGPLSATHERSLKRALKGLVDRGDVLIVNGFGGPGEHYVTVECFASSTGEMVKDTAYAKQIVAELQDAVNRVLSSRIERTHAVAELKAAAASFAAGQG